MRRVMEGGNKKDGMDKRDGAYLIFSGDNDGWWSTMVVGGRWQGWGGVGREGRDK